MRCLGFGACLLACAMSQQVMAQGPKAGAAVMASKSETAEPWAEENMAAMTKMQEAMTSIPPVGNEDQAFVRGMLPHHQGAVDMAKVELAYGHDPKMRRLARAIVNSQEDQIGIMQAWLKAHSGGS